jgi:hypothetical protein
MKLRTGQSTKGEHQRSSKRVLVTLFRATLFVLALSPGLRAQTTSVLEGLVTDQQGFAICGAEIRATNSAVAIERHATTETSGVYRIAGLPPGVYTITASKADCL